MLPSHSGVKRSWEFLEEVQDLMRKSDKVKPGFDSRGQRRRHRPPCGDRRSLTQGGFRKSCFCTHKASHGTNFRWGDRYRHINPGARSPVSASLNTKFLKRLCLVILSPDLLLRAINDFLRYVSFFTLSPFSLNLFFSH